MIKALILLVMVAIILTAFYFGFIYETPRYTRKVTEDEKKEAIRKTEESCKTPLKRDAKGRYMKRK